MLGVLALLIFFMFRNSRKRKADQESLQDKMVPGAEVMTNFGLFGTLISIDDDSNVAIIETSPGSTIRLHRQTLARVIEDDVVEEELESDETMADASSALTETNVSEPRLNESSLDAPAEKPKRSKKLDN